MMYPNNPSYNDDDYEGCVTAGRATGRPIPPPSAEALRRLEEAWNAPAFSGLWKDEGFVSSNWVVKPRIDPNTPLVPSEKDIAKLPRWARVAFAARCARRVLPIVKKLWVDAPIHRLQVFDNAVSLAEWAAAYAYTARVAANAARGAAAVATAAAIVAAADADDDIANADNADVTYARAAAAVRSLIGVSTVSTFSYLVAPAHDFDALFRLAKKEQWTDDTPVPPSVFGPMWDGPPPEWWSDEPLTDPVSE